MHFCCNPLQLSIFRALTRFNNAKSYPYGAIEPPFLGSKRFESYLRVKAFGVARVNFNGLNLALLVSAAMLGGVCVATSCPLLLDLPVPQPFM